MKNCFCRFRSQYTYTKCRYFYIYLIAFLLLNKTRLIYSKWRTAVLTRTRPVWNARSAHPSRLRVNATRMTRNVNGRTRNTAGAQP
jgi:hypothetical protein